ncbi:DUF2398 family protein [Saccharothrix australiensis]|uniref:Uncharacterized protein (TIGR02678 family) n=1 Tax=Saccharothrix australiensis TaxID=2072 RepID=A0A495W1H9_9PSEU|nr:DUF2398 family protein [Saccharothrix australiensis]RKT55522.1 uncharacterized protein (TIGR02678 family) [Saccharothrix australiensis]
MNRDAAERQRAFTALLRSPVVDRHSHPEVWPLVRVHRVTLGEWFAQRLGYRLLVTDSAARLFRLPVDGVVLAPRRFRPPSRRVLVLAVLAAAAAEDAEDLTTTQDLSDRVRVLSTRDDVELATYDPDRFAERTLFVKAVRLLVSLGALRPTGRDDEEQREGWAHRRDAIGGAYEVRRELLLRLVDPTSLRAALGDRSHDGPPHEAAARVGLMRKLVELPVVLHEDLTDAERAYLTGQRHRVLAWCAEMTGWVVEQRAEGMALIAADEADTDLPFPRLRAADFAALMVLDELLRLHGVDSVVTADDLASAAAEVRVRHAKAMTNDLRTGDAVEAAARDVLGALDLLRPTGTPRGWRLTPAAARYRDPRVVAVTARLDEEGAR